MAFTEEISLNMTDVEFRLLRELIHEKAGLYFSDSKKNLLQSRLVTRLMALNLKSFEEYYLYLKFSPGKEKEFRKMISLVTNNETYFFRESYQLEDLVEIVLLQIKEKKKTGEKIKILSAGCSSGEEPYSIGMMIMEKLPLLNLKSEVEIYAMDIDEVVLEKAVKGVYTDNSFRATDPIIQHRYFIPTPEGKKIRDSIKNMVNFFWGNIVDFSTYHHLDKMDVIFCRNVLIYFSDKMINQVAQNFFQLLSNEGILFLGHSESLLRITDIFETRKLKRSIGYVKSRDFI